MLLTIKNLEGVSSLKTITYSRTSEAVAGGGHPDKLCDIVADSIFDYLRTYKLDAQSAVEVSASANKLMLFGEIDADIVYGDTCIRTDSRNVEIANPELAENIEEIAVDAIRAIGYGKELYNPEIIFDIVTQSVEINNAVEGKDTQDPAAGDQGIVNGFAVAETNNYHALHFILAHELMIKLEEDRTLGRLPFLLPDAKSQVTVEYTGIDDGTGNIIDKPTAIKHILVSQSHSSDVDFDDFAEGMEDRVKEIIKDYIRDNSNKLYATTLINSVDSAELLINPAGPWTTPGPAYDSGLVGRKLVVDNYGSAASIGGGATSGKNLNKVDRSGAYFARHVAKSIVASGLAHKATVEIGFAIGVSQPTAINIDTHGTEKVSHEKILKAVNDSFDFRVKNIIKLSASMDKFVKASKHGNYTNNEFPWEKTVDIRIS